MQGYAIYVIDTETTGLESSIHDIVELSMLRFSLDGSLTPDQKTWLVKAVNIDTISDEALKINGHKREDICHITAYGRENYKEPSEVISDVENWIMEDNVSSIDRIFAGQNPNFDIGFMKEMWRRTQNEVTFPFSVERGNRTLDTKHLALIVDLCTGRRRQRYDLSGLVKSFKVKKGKAHRADEDTRMTHDLIVNILSPIKEHIAEAFASAYDSEE